MTVVIGLKARIHCHFVGIEETANITPDSSGSTWRMTGIMYRTSRKRTFTADRRSPPPRAVSTASAMKSGANSTSTPPGHVS